MKDWLMSQSVGELVAAMGFIIGVLALAWKVGKAFYELLSKLKDTVDDLNGEPARPGVEARRGVMERMQALETSLQAHTEEVREALAKQDTAIGDIRYHVQPNGGNSSHDKLMREMQVVIGRTASMESRLDEHIETGRAFLEAVTESFSEQGIVIPPMPNQPEGKPQISLF